MDHALTQAPTHVDVELLSPRTGEPLRPDGEHHLTDGEVRYPIVAGIAFLRPKPELRARVSAALDAGDERAALRHLLADQDRFSPTAPPGAEALDRLLDEDARGTLTLREAMRLLNFGPVGDYFAHRWSSPTFLSGLALLERAAPPDAPVVEVACGIGHFLRHLERAGRQAVGVDIVFAKLWLARRLLGVRGPLVCGDIEAGPVVASSGTVFCHDAFYFLEHKAAALQHMQRIARGGPILIGHVHTRTDAHEAGFAERLEDYRTLLPEGMIVYDDLSLARSSLDPGSEQWPVATERSEALAWVLGESAGGQSLPEPNLLQINPLLWGGGIAWPSEGWRREYTDDARALGPYSLAELAEQPELRSLVTGGAPALAALSTAERTLRHRQRVLLDLPERW